MLFEDVRDSLSLNRRQLLAGGLATAATLALPTPSFGALGNARLVEIAKRELERAGARIWLKDVVGLADCSLPSGEPRFFLLDMVSGFVKRFYVTHGKGSDPQHDGWLKSFSNEDGSYATSRGAYLTRQFYDGKNRFSMRLFGLDPDNSNADPRAIVIHAAAYADPGLIATQGKLGRSEGCFVFPEANLMEVLGRLGPGRLLFADKLSPQVIPPAPVPVSVPLPMVTPSAPVL
jgi:L,D-transpeptidase catalytic domain